MAGYEAFGVPPRYASLDLVVAVCARPDAFRGDVEEGVLDALRDFFHPDNFTFGAPLERSALEAAVQDVPGVDGVTELRVPPPRTHVRVRADARHGRGRDRRDRASRQRPQSPRRRLVSRRGRRGEVTDVCPDDVVVHPRGPINAAGARRRRLPHRRLSRRSVTRCCDTRHDEHALVDWQPGAEGDLGVQLLEWWAYLADVLTFYNERALVEGLLRTAVSAEASGGSSASSATGPRPGIGATGVVAALTDSQRPFVLPRGLPIKGPAGPARRRCFEIDEDVEIGVVGRTLPRRRGSPTTTVERLPRPTYAPRLRDGRLLDRLEARDARRHEFPPVEAGEEVFVALEGVVTNVAPNEPSW